tara:strand:+ start:508 stop:633 length:126 start_codon:yes stop_codon:yes gene_type:complete
MIDVKDQIDKLNEQLKKCEELNKKCSETLAVIEVLINHKWK